MEKSSNLLCPSYLSVLVEGTSRLLTEILENTPHHFAGSPPPQKKDIFYCNCGMKTAGTMKLYHASQNFSTDDFIHNRGYAGLIAIAIGTYDAI